LNSRSIDSTKITPPAINRMGTSEKLKTPNKGYCSGSFEYELNIVKTMMRKRVIPAALINLSLNISRNIFIDYFFAIRWYRTPDGLYNTPEYPGELNAKVMISVD
jgi:hypothetical protein